MTNAPAELAEIRADLDRGLKLIADKSKAYDKARAMYEGTADEVITSPALRRRLNESAQAHPLGFAHIPVDACLDKVKLVGITAKEGAPAEALERFYDEGDLDDEADDWHTKAGYFGDYYVVIDPREEDEDGVATELTVAGSSPLSTVMVYSSRDERTPLYGVKRWAEGSGASKRWHAALYYDDATVLLVTPEAQGENVPDAAIFLPNLDEEGTEGSERVPHEGGRMLLVHYAVDGKPYGRPLHRKAFGAQDAITKISATNLATVEGQGFPFRYALLDPAGAIDDDLDADFGTDGPDTEPSDTDGLTGATNGSKVKNEPGTMALLRGIKSVGELSEGSPDGALKNLEFYLRAMAVITGTPLFEFDMKGEQPSGEARRRAEGRINKRAAKVARAFGNAHKTLADTVLALLGIEPEGANVTVKWGPIETSTDAEGLELVGLKVKHGVPLREALVEAGYNPETVAEWFPEEGLAYSPDLVTALADALVKLGNAQTLGALTAEQAATMLPVLLAGGERAARDAAADAEPDATIVEDSTDEATSPALAAAELELAQVKVKREQFEAVGIAARAGADQLEAAKAVGLTGVSFPNVPTTVRIPKEEAGDLEGGAPAAPSAPTPPAPPEPPADEPVDEPGPDEA